MYIYVHVYRYSRRRDLCAYVSARRISLVFVRHKPFTPLPFVHRERRDTSLYILRRARAHREYLSVSTRPARRASREPVVSASRPNRLVPPPRPPPLPPLPPLPPPITNNYGSTRVFVSTRRRRRLAGPLLRTGAVFGRYRRLVSNSFFSLGDGQYTSVLAYGFAGRFGMSPVPPSPRPFTFLFLNVSLLYLGHRTDWFFWRDEKFK